MKKWFIVQFIVILSGTIFAWYTVVMDYLKFYDVEGTIFRIKDCAFPNPVTTPCFWGAWGFVVALVWSIMILRKKVDASKKSQYWLTWFLVGGSIFGWSNTALLFVKFMQAGGEPTIGCSGQIMTNPFTTPCFIGAALFLASLIAAFLTYRALRASLATIVQPPVTPPQTPVL